MDDYYLAIIIALYSWMWGLQRVADVNRLLDVQRYIEKHPADYVPERLKFVQSKVNYMVGNVKEGEQLMREFIFNTDESDVEVLAKTAFCKAACDFIVTICIAS